MGKPSDEPREHGRAGHAFGTLRLQHRKLGQIGQEPEVADSYVGHQDESREVTRCSKVKPQLSTERLDCIGNRAVTEEGCKFDAAWSLHSDA